MRRKDRIPPAIAAADQHEAVKYDLFKRVRPVIKDIIECNLTLLHWAETGGATPAYVQELQMYINPAWPRPATYLPIPYGWAFSTVAAPVAPAVAAAPVAPTEPAVAAAPVVPPPRRGPDDKGPAAIFLRNTRQLTALQVIPRLRAIAARSGVAEAEATRAALCIGLAALEKDPALLWKAASLAAEGGP